MILNVLNIFYHNITFVLQFKINCCNSVNYSELLYGMLYYSWVCLPKISHLLNGVEIAPVSCILVGWLLCAVGLLSCNLQWLVAHMTRQLWSHLPVEIRLNAIRPKTISCNFQYSAVQMHLVPCCFKAALLWWRRWNKDVLILTLGSVAGCACIYDAVLLTRVVLLTGILFFTIGMEIWFATTSTC